MNFQMQFDAELLDLLDCPRSKLQYKVEDFVLSLGGEEIVKFDEWLLDSKCVRRHEIAVLASETKYSERFRQTAQIIARAIEDRAAKAKAAK